MRAANSTMPMRCPWMSACSDKGLTLVDYPAGQRPLFPGQLIIPEWPAKPKIDHKSKAILLPYKGKTAQK